MSSSLRRPSKLDRLLQSQLKRNHIEIEQKKIETPPASTNEPIQIYSPIDGLFEVKGREQYNDQLLQQFTALRGYSESYRKEFIEKNIHTIEIESFTSYTENSIRALKESSIAALKRNENSDMSLSEKSVYHKIIKGNYDNIIGFFEELINDIKSEHHTYVKEQAKTSEAQLPVTLVENMSSFLQWSQESAALFQSELQPVAQQNYICGCGGIGRTAFC